MDAPLVLRSAHCGHPIDHYLALVERQMAAVKQTAADERSNNLSSRANVW